MAENLNKEREGRTDKVMKKKKKRERKEKEREIAREFFSVHPCLSQIKKKKKKKKRRKRISKLLILRRKESFRFSFLFMSS